MPLGDLSDFNALETANPETWQDVEALAANYDVREIIVARAERQPRGPDSEVWRVSATRFGPDAAPSRLGFSRTLQLGEDQERAELFQSAARVLLSEVDAATKARLSNLRSDIGIALLDVRLPAQDKLDAWSALSSLLDTSSAVERSNTLALLQAGALVELRHIGGQERIREELRNSGFLTSEAGTASDGTPVLRVERQRQASLPEMDRNQAETPGGAAASPGAVNGTAQRENDRSDNPGEGTGQSSADEGAPANPFDDTP
jgi:hypothetical protein